MPYRSPFLVLAVAALPLAGAHAQIFAPVSTRPAGTPPAEVQNIKTVTPTTPLEDALRKAVERLPKPEPITPANPYVRPVAPAKPQAPAVPVAPQVIKVAPPSATFTVLTSQSFVVTPQNKALVASPPPPGQEAPLAISPAVSGQILQEAAPPRPAPMPDPDAPVKPGNAL